VQVVPWAALLAIAVPHPSPRRLHADGASCPLLVGSDTSSRGPVALAVAHMLLFSDGVGSLWSMSAAPADTGRALAALPAGAAYPNHAHALDGEDGSPAVRGHPG